MVLVTCPSVVCCVVVYRAPRAQKRKGKLRSNRFVCACFERKPPFGKHGGAVGMIALGLQGCEISSRVSTRRASDQRRVECVLWLLLLTRANPPPTLVETALHAIHQTDENHRAGDCAKVVLNHQHADGNDVRANGWRQREQNQATEGACRRVCPAEREK